MRITKKKVGAALGLLALLGGGAVAYAYFTDSGSGNGAASVGTSTVWSVTNLANGGTLLPGAGTSTLTYKITNASSGNPSGKGITEDSVIAGGPPTKMLTRNGAPFAIAAA